jgi:hypothetical protein
MTGTYLSQLIVSLKTQVQWAFSHLQHTHTRHQLSLDVARLRGLDVESVNSSSDCIPASETTLYQKRMSVADQSHLRQQTVETNCKNETC